MLPLEITMKDAQCTMCAKKFRQWEHTHEEDCNLCRIAEYLHRMCVVIEERF